MSRSRVHHWRNVYDYKTNPSPSYESYDTNNAAPRKQSKESRTKAELIADPGKILEKVRVSLLHFLQVRMRWERSTSKSIHRNIGRRMV